MTPMRAFDRVLLGVLVLAALALGFLAFGPASAATPSAGDAHSVIAKMIGREPHLSSYSSRVHVDVKMLYFPYFAPKLDGTSTYKRGGSYEVVFDRMPSYAKGFSHLFDDVGDPAAWERDQNAVVDGTRTIDGHTYLVLDLTKKIHSTILTRTLAFVDPSNYQLARMEWDYTSGGTIVMDQTYRTEGGFALVSTQHATIQIPHIHAVADATYGKYETNGTSH